MAKTRVIDPVLVALATVAVLGGAAWSAGAAIAEPQAQSPVPESLVRAADEDCTDPDTPLWPCEDPDSTPAPTMPTPAQTAPVRGVLNLTKQAYINVTDKSTVETVEATGTLLPPHQSLPIGTEICFVYILTNDGQSRPPWSGIWVDELRDFDTRLGDNGVIARPGYLTSPQKYHACTTAIYLIAKP
jgi:hypothetical protein